MKKTLGRRAHHCFVGKLLTVARRLLRGCIHVRLCFTVEFTFPAASPLSLRSVLLRWCSLAVLILVRWSDVIPALAGGSASRSATLYTSECNWSWVRDEELQHRQALAVAIQQHLLPQRFDNGSMSIHISLPEKLEVGFRPFIKVEVDDAAMEEAELEKIKKHFFP
ncbi:hypothetical protein C2S52_021392 [Perilla frutescens var. hirtella]|nr:hypothetical protein C2S52_021392 [Perilla frutescens var. hirtella]